MDILATALDEKTKGRIYAMFKKGAPTRVIVEETGASKSTVNAMRKAWKESGAHAGAHARIEGKPTEGVRSTEPTDQTTEPTEPTTALEVTRSQMAEEAKKYLTFIADRAKEGYSRAVLCEDAHDRAWMETQFLKVLHQSAVQLGKWGGLDSTVDKDNAILSEYAKVMQASLKDVEVEDWEAKP